MENLNNKDKASENAEKELRISDVSKRYIAKKDTWFKEGTECKLLEDYQEVGGLYQGIYIVGENKGYDTFWHKKGYKEGDEVEMNEVCSHDEFNVC